MLFHLTFRGFELISAIVRKLIHELGDGDAKHDTASGGRKRSPHRRVTQDIEHRQ
jgi:hypothetical protein